MAPISEREKQLLEISKQFDSAITNHDYSKLDGLVADNVVVHKDHLTLREDLKGKAALKHWLQSYSDKYTFQHEVIAGAVDPNNYAFSFWVDKHVTPKPEAFSTGLSEDAKKPSDTLGIWHLSINAQSDKIDEIFFLRQLSRDEIQRKLKTPVDYSSLKLDVHKLKGSGTHTSEERAHAMHDASQKFNDIWAKCDPSLADGIMVDDVRQLDLILAKELRGRDSFKKMIEQYSQSWTPKSNTNRIAVTAGNKGFIFWLSQGHSKTSGEDQLYGLNMLVFDDAGKINEILGFREPLQAERDGMLKEVQM